MNAISLWQPWASLWINGVKRNETRSWELLRRGWIAVHAAKGGLSKQNYAEQIRAPFFRDHIIEPLPRGAIIGVVYLERSVRIERCLHCKGDGGFTCYDSKDRVTCSTCWGHGACPGGTFLTPQEAAFGNYDLSEGTRYAWVTSQNKPLATPIPFSGKQGIFSLPAPIVSEIMKQVTL